MFISLVFICIGFTMVFRPEIIWSITEAWKSEGAYGPTGLFELSTKFGGIMFIIVGFFNLTLQIFFIS